ncbi:Protein ABCI7 [Forsythia ovata]|uniref:Protein ABCI7 n=1 Tax=Forsythia ovata TaxID=205694 RepID=A0ABD1W2Z4_9LAMI
MVISILPPIIHPPTALISQSLSSCLPNLLTPRSKSIPRTSKARVFTQSQTLAILSDPHVLQLAETLEDSLQSSSSPPLPPLQKLRDISSQSLLSTSWPSRKDEPFRFTDTSFIKNSHIEPISPSESQSLASLPVSSDTLLPLHVTILDGYVVDSLSQLSELPDGVFVGGLSSLNSEATMKRVSEYVPNFQGDLFWLLNGVGAPDIIVVYVPEGCRVESPLHLKYFSLKGSEKDSKTLPISNPRVLVLVEKGGEIGIVEEHTGVDETDKCYWANSVMEIVIGNGAKVSHSYIQTQSLGAAHVKWTSVRQESKSIYELTEVSTGGKLSRHNLHVQQLGPDTVTELSTFHLSIGDQIQDLHSKLVLDHPRGVSRQLHKCIVAHSLGQAVFDGNVQVNRDAQQTDAGQLTRSLLLEPRATVNIKPNLQIIADDVKCSHGAAISDLEDDQLFYFQARGIDIVTARKALIISFASEVIERFPNTCVQNKVESHVRKLLDPTPPSS